MKKILKKLSIILQIKKEVINWKIPILHYFGLRKKEDVIEFKNKMKCIIRNKSDAIAFFEVFFLKTNNSLKGFEINSHDIVVDIGAHVGYFSIYSASRNKDGKIYSFEPYIESFKILEKNLKINNITNVVPINLGVSKNAGNLDLYLQSNFAIGNSIYGERNSKSKIQIKTISLRDIINEYKITKIDFLKLDCEGSEYEILLNLDKISLDKIKRIVAEMHPDIEDYKIKDVIDFLNTHKFAVKIIKPTQDDSELVMLYAIREKSNKQ